MLLLSVLTALWWQLHCHSLPLGNLSVKVSPLASYKLDISNPADLDKVKTIECDLDDIPSFIFVPKFGVDVNKITDGNLNLWVSDTHQTLVLATVHCTKPLYRRSGYYLFRVVARDLYGEVVVNLYRYLNGSYQLISDSMFDDELRLMRIKVPSHQKVVMDINDTFSSDMFVHEDVVFDGVFASVHIPRKGYHAKALVEGELPIWKGMNGERCTNALVYYKALDAVFAQVSILDDNDVEDTLYLRKKGNKWEAVGEEKFYKKFSKEFLFSANDEVHSDKKLPEPLDGNVKHVLDISHPGKTLLVCSHVRGAVNYKTYLPNGGSIMSIVDGEADIWTASRDENCKFVSSYAFEDLTVLYVHIERGENFDFKYFGKGESGWQELTSKEYNEILNKFVDPEDDTFSSGSELDITLDISDVDELLFDTQRHTEEPVGIVEYTSIPGAVISRVVDGKEKIWDPSDKEVKCTRAIVDTVEGVPTALYLTIVKHDNSTIHKIYGMKGDKWAVLEVLRIHEPEEEPVNAARFSHRDELASLFGDDYDDEDLSVLGNGLPTEVEPILNDWLEDSFSKTQDKVGSTWSDELLALDENEYQFEHDYYNYDSKYDSELLGEEFEHPSKPSIPLSVCLDISELKYSKAEVIDARAYARPFILYNSLRGNPITCVADGNQSIWKALEGERCLFASSFVEGEDLRLLEISVKDKVSTYRKYFQKIGGEWVEVDLESFEKRMGCGKGPAADSFLTGGYMAVLALVAFVFSF
ncbi:hypothetical protein BEWA_049960 [Theileria equi strain WA]|uniref:Signal peptide-containing protein n=1 Tax=Theileria equi strain WA TaxID=1537102 RepID=L1LBH6_THEEQ|nr:hypothetical protein BEWA_049960 [Theileria equi strain WA]EKX72528.1 hypothetical protein BEWA_049960 [Theileria equi strain WA]|eukprot:XP_004831980.1 hypothetical protein BEWA_049960 [Theileria equi strain WA]